VAISARAQSPSVEQLQVLTYQLQVLGSDRLLFTTPQGSESYDLKIDPKSLDYRTLRTLLRMLREGRLREEEQTLFGEFLYNILLNNEAGNTLHKMLRKEPPSFLRVELHLRFAAQELAELPWEYLYRPSPEPNGAYFLATQNRLALVRCPRVGETRSLGLPAGEKLKVLLVACSPADEEQLEFAGFIAEMQQLQLEGKLTLTTLITPYQRDVRFASEEHPNPEATYDNFLAALSDNPHVVHFLGHGKVDTDGGKIAFVRSSYAADWRRTKDLAKAFGDSTFVRLTFLQACETSATTDAAVAYRALSTVAGALAETGIPAIVAMQTRIRIGDASSFAGVFYRAIVNDRVPLFRAMQLARQATSEAAACIPVLYLRYDASRKEQADWLFDEPSAMQSGSSPSAGKSVEGGQCPWCRQTLDPQQAQQECCPRCGSDLRCPGCKTPIVGMIEEGTKSIRCQRRECRAVICRFVDTQVAPASTGVDKAVEPRGFSTARTTDASKQALGELQKDVFGMPIVAGERQGA
jgi:hypothetical protein